MATVAILPTPPIPTGPAAAVEQVTSTMEMLHDKMEGYENQFQGILGSMIDAANIDDTEFAAPDLDFQFGTPSLQPTVAVLDSDVGLTIDTNVPTPPSLTPTLPAKPAVGNYTPPDAVVINLPSRPTAFNGALPVKPVVDYAIAVPDAPTVDAPVEPEMLAITVPTFTMPDLPSFNEVAPEFTAALPGTVLAFAEPDYESESLDEIMATLKRVRLDGTGLPPAIEQAIYDRGRAREDRAAEKAVQEVFDAHAGRGFPAPSGQLHAQVQAVREGNQLAVSALSRDVLVRATDVEIEQLRFAVIQGLAAEQILVNIFSNAAQRAFEQAKFTVEMAVRLHDAMVAVFNTLMSAWQTKATVHKMQLDAEIQKLEAYRLQLEGEKLKGDINTQRIQLLEARIRTVLSRVEVYKGQLQGAEIKSQMVKNILDGYRTDVQAFGETVSAKKLEFDAYKTAADAEKVKADIGSTNASVFQTLVGADEAKVRMWTQEAQLEISRMGLVSQGYGQRLDAFRTLNAAQLGRVTALSDLKRTAISATQVGNQAAIGANEAVIRIGEQRMQSNIAKANIAVRLYETNLTKLNQQKEIQARALQAAGQYLATLAGGAMAAQHVSASISSSATDGYSVTQSTNLNNTLNEKV